ncbi:hypothetical protein [Gordonia sp. CPCC 205333]|uniref:hypothetical protein n=1 Tax=Gordonia sp. CPCC 205333 TaxID=3140790 RepID=UPI003AF373D4
MLRWVALLGALLVVFVGIVTGEGRACACSCVSSAPEDAVRHADAIVVGTPVARVEGPDYNAYFTVEIAHSFKRAVAQRITVESAASSSACGVDMPIGRQRVIVLTDSGVGSGQPKWTASLCGNLDPEATVALAGDRFDALSESQVREPPDIPASNGKIIALTSIGALALLTVGIVGVVLVRRRRAA